MSDEEENWIREHGANPVNWPEWQADKRLLRSVCVCHRCPDTFLCPPWLMQRIAWHCAHFLGDGYSPFSDHEIIFCHTAIGTRIWIICPLWQGSDICMLSSQMYEITGKKCAGSGSCAKTSLFPDTFRINVTTLHSRREKAGWKPQNN